MIECAVLEAKTLPPTLTSRICIVDDGRPIVRPRHASKYGENLPETTINDGSRRPKRPFAVKCDVDRAGQPAYLPSQGTTRYPSAFSSSMPYATRSAMFRG